MCADIFGGVEPPRWLQDLTSYKKGQFGESVGLALGAGLLAVQKDENGDMKGIEQGLAEARLNQADPNWKVKEKALEANVVSNWARAATEWQSFDATSRDMAAWTTKDLPAISKFQQELKTNPDALPPVVESSKGIQAVGQLERAQMQIQAMKLRQDNSKIALDNQKTSVAFDQAVSAAPVSIGSAIDELPNQGWNVDRQGRRTTPSTAALALYNNWATGNGDAPEKAFGYKPNAIEVARERGAQTRLTEADREKNREILANVKADRAEDLSKLNAEQKRAYESLRQDDRKEIENLKGDKRIDIEKMRELARQNERGEKYSLKEFVDKHWNVTFTNLSKTAPPTESKAMTAAKTEKLLSGVYFRVDKEAQTGGTGVQEAAPRPVPQAAPAAAPAKKDSTNDKDPLGLFSK